MLLQVQQNNASLKIATASLSIAIMLPFEPQMTGKNVVEQRIATAMLKVKKELMIAYTADITIALLTRLQKTVAQINYNCFKKSIVLLISATTERILYLDLQLEEKVVVGTDFSMRDLIKSRKQPVEFLVMIAGKEKYETWHVNEKRFTCIDTNQVKHIQKYRAITDTLRKENSDAEDMNAELADLVTEQMDKTLGLLLPGYPFPVFIMAGDTICDYFWATTMNAAHIAGYLPGNYEVANETVIRNMLRPHTGNWLNVKQYIWLKQAEEALYKGLLVTGIQQVQKAARRSGEGLLLIEKGYERDNDSGTVPMSYFKSRTADTPHYIQNEVDEIILNVLLNGGDVAIMEAGSLKLYGGIALMQKKRQERILSSARRNFL